MAIDTQAPEWQVSRWFNAPAPLSLAALRGRVVVIEAFQMLCPGCVSHGLPQAQRVRQVFAREDVEVIGLHTVFEHHAAMTPVALEAFLHEYRIGFPVGVDAASEAGAIPRTMAAYGMRGTPTLLLVDRVGRLRQHHFGQVEDLMLGAQIAMLAAEPVPGPATGGAACSVDGSCD
ncbi:MULTISPECIES: redoxin domain-containing protein [Thermomonas]|jgi:thiol-disulfide isomerase/thioredoxin|uniref:Redoxin domain-containing protein n=1 Tax=Thermomonas fusca TaxID=215690 RepID=A0A5R9PET2_9GAMM|nr:MULTISPECIES: redoxin domain-containing protein [Thermomonas]TLX21100.1 redoxin domain-containing protein [Thermomonas fusca]